MKRAILITNDVETTSIVNGGLSDKTGEKVWKVGIPLLMELYEKYNIKSTFFYTGYIADKFPEIVRMIIPYGHEVACHGLSHKHDEAFDVLSYDQQVYHLQKAKDILESISNQDVISFRAPALRTNHNTVKALHKAGFKYDSSVAPQRADIFMTLGSKEKLKWLRAPRKVYETSTNSLSRKGNSGIYEIPVSNSLGMPYIGTFMRMSPFLTGLIRNIIYLETRNIAAKPVNFLVHPNELITEAKNESGISRRSKNYLTYLLSDIVRNSLKQKNLGNSAKELLEREIKSWAERCYSFKTLRSFMDEIIKT